MPRCFLERLVQPPVVDRQRRLRRERLQEGDHLSRERPRNLAGHHQAAEDVVLAQQRHRQDRAHASGEQPLADVRGQHVRRLDILDLDRCAGRSRSADGALAEAEASGLERRGEIVGDLVGGADLEDALGLVVLVDDPAIGTGEAGGVPDDGREHLLKVQRGGERLPDLAKRLQLVHTVLQLLEQPGVLDGDDGLVGERLQQRDLPVGVGALFVAVDGDHSDRLTFTQERCCEQ